MAYKPEDDIDALLRQVNEILDEQTEKPAASQPVRNFSNNYGRAASPVSGGIPAYNPDYEAAQKRGMSPNLPSQEPEYGEDDGYAGQYDEYDEYYADAPAPEEPARETSRRRGGTAAEEGRKAPVKRKKKHRLLKLFLVITLIVGIVLGVMLVIARAPQTDTPLGARKDGAVTILLCGTDQEGTRTDTMMLLYLNPSENAMNLVSLPRDTLTRTTAGNYAKLNSAFGRNNGGSDPVEGMENLLLYVKDIVGYVPDGYMLIDLNCFIDVVDAMGGVEFDVPQDMYYEDPSQDLYIDLKAGRQTLNGYAAMGLVRFRKGYSNQDLGRVSVQRDFIAACMDQWLTLGNIGKLPALLSLVTENATTDLSTGNFLWLGLNALKVGVSNIQTATLPGYGDMIGGASYYVLYPGQVADMVNEYCNPYEREITRNDLDIAG